MQLVLLSDVDHEIDSPAIVVKCHFADGTDQNSTLAHRCAAGHPGGLRKMDDHGVAALPDVVELAKPDDQAPRHQQGHQHQQPHPEFLALIGHDG
jgi:hypothetical protein